MSTMRETGANAGDQLIAAAKRGDRAQVVAAFRAAELFIVSTPVDASVDPESMTEVEFAVWVEAGAQAGTEDFAPLVVQMDGGPVLPVFTSLDRVEAFVEAYVGFNASAGSLVTASVDGVDLVPCLEPGIGILLDPGGAEVRLSDDAMSALLTSAS